MTDLQSALLAKLGNPDAAVRQVALAQLDEVLDERALAPLIAALADPEGAVRILAIGLLEDLGDHRAIPAIIAAL